LFSYMKQGPGFYREVALLSAPIILQNLITSTLGMADTFMVGLLGELPMAAVTLANIPMFVIQLFIFGVQSGSSVLFNQYWGKKDLEAINRVMGVAMWAVLLITCVYASILLLYPVEFLSLFGNQPEVIELAARYGRIAGLSWIFDSVVLVYISVYRSMEQPKLGMYILVASMLTNTFLNWVFIFGNLGAPALGVEGAALATLIARILEFAIMVGHALTNRSFALRPGLLLRPGGAMARRFLIFGFPVILNETMWGMGTSAYTTVMGHMEGSTEILAAYTIAGNVEKICMVVSFGISATAAIIIGREIGAGRSDKVQEIALVLITLTAGFGVVIGAGLFLFARLAAPVLIFPLFKLSASAAAIATMMMTVRAVIFPLHDFNGVVIVGVLRGGGDVKAATLIDILPLWLVAIPLTALCGLVLKLDILWVYLVMCLEQLVKLVLGLWRMKSGKWIRDITRGG